MATSGPPSMSERLAASAFLATQGPTNTTLRSGSPARRAREMATMGLTMGDR